MPDYAVTIKLKGGSPAEIVSYVALAFGRVVAEQAGVIEWERLKYLNDPCQEEGHFCCVHWTDDDVERRFHKLNVAFTPELLEGVKNDIRHLDDGMTELGWEVIEDAIREAVEIEPPDDSLRV
jgi:hypothetical protein